VTQIPNKILDRLEKANTPNFVQALSVLDEEAKNIIAELWLHHTGWL